eukprot:scaffold5006_cov116-Isochrysis_galbana.AAC.7
MSATARGTRRRACYPAVPPPRAPDARGLSEGLRGRRAPQRPPHPLWRRRYRGLRGPRQPPQGRSRRGRTQSLWGAQTATSLPAVARGPRRLRQGQSPRPAEWHNQLEGGCGRPAQRSRGRDRRACVR